MQTLKSALEYLKLPADEATCERFRLYRELVLAWNEKVNLTAIRDPEAFERKHFVDSLLCAASPAFHEAKTVIDIGTGAGFPGVPLAICFPEKHFVLVDSLGKRIRILGEMTAAIGLKNVTAIHARAEDLARDPAHRERYDLCVSRAVADLAVLAEYCLPFVKKGGSFAAYKSLSADEEIERSKKAIGYLGGVIAEALAESKKVNVPGADPEHGIVWIRKTGETPKKFPRKAGTPGKEPLS